MIAQRILTAISTAAALGPFLLGLTESRLAEAGELKPVVAVFDVTTEGLSIPAKTLALLTGYLNSRLTAEGTYSVLPGESIKEAMIQLKIESQNDCYDQTCRIELGRASAAQKTLNSLVWKLDDQCSLTLDLYDLRTEIMERSVEIPGIKCSESGLKDAISEGAVRISGQERPASTASERNEEYPVRTTEKSQRSFESPPEIGYQGLTVLTNPSPMVLELDAKTVGVSPLHLKEMPKGKHKIIADGSFVPVSVERLTQEGDRFDPAGSRARISKLPFESEVTLELEDHDSGVFRINYSAMKVFVEWFGMNLGGGFIFKSLSPARLDLSLFTLNGRFWYYTVLEGGPMLVMGLSGVGGRAGYQKYLGKGWVARVGLKLGFAWWMEGDFEPPPGFYSDDWRHTGFEVSPHVQFVKFFSHASVGAGIDIPILIDVIGDMNSCPGYGSSTPCASSVAGGIHAYFRWTVY